jgi:hypothetical protein
MRALFVRRSEVCWRAIVVLFGLAFLATSSVASEIFKCVAKDGTPLYQNFPCDIDSLGSLPSDPLKVPPVPAAAGQGQPKTAPVNVTLSGEPRVGMTSDQVRALLGEPQEMIEDEPATGGRISTWRYADGRSVQFDHKHRVLSVQR